MQKPAPPFSTSTSPNIPELLHQLNISLAVSTYQAGKIVLVAAPTVEKLVVLPRNFSQATALEFSEQKIAIADVDSVHILKNEPGLAKYYPKQPSTYDSFFVPQLSYYTGPIAAHGIGWGNDGLWVVNTLFSCLSLMTEDFSFEPKWRPYFIEELKPADQCHLNGMVMENGAPRYVTAFNADAKGNWREGNYHNGMVIDVPSNALVAEGLDMPHSPILIDGRLYMLLSASGDLIEVNRDSGEVTKLKQLDGFLRGLAFYEDYLFIGESKIRQNSSTFKNMEIAGKANTAGIYVMHFPTKSIVGKIEFAASVEEIYDVKVLPGMNRPGILNTESELRGKFFSLPGKSWWVKG
jgi:uncharacterized protein (TIGR03032 family)